MNTDNKNQSAKIQAVRQQTSISRVLNDRSRKPKEDSSYYNRAKKQALRYMSKGFHLGGEAKVSKEELHERLT